MSIIGRAKAMQVMSTQSDSPEGSTAPGEKCDVNDFFLFFLSLPCGRFRRLSVNCRARVGIGYHIGLVSYMVIIK